MNQNQSEKKPFDPTVSFMFFGSWVKTIHEIKEQFGVAAAYTMFEAIAEYSMYGNDPDFHDFQFLTIVWPTIEREVDLSVSNRKRGFSKDTLNDNYQAIIKAIIENPNASLRAIGAMTGTGKNMVDRVRHKYSAEINAALSCSADGDKEKANPPERDSACSVDVAPVNAVDRISANANDSLGRDNTGQTRAIELDRLISDLSSRMESPLEARRQFSVMDRTVKRAISCNCIEIDNMSERAKWSSNKWNRLYSVWMKSISTEATEAILKKYLSTHEEPPTLKKMGDKYGRIIRGWDAERLEPIIAYSFSYLDKAEGHEIKDVPTEYYMTGEEIIQIDEEEDYLFEEAVEDLMAERRWTREEAIAFLDGSPDDEPF